MSRRRTRRSSPTLWFIPLLCATASLNAADISWTAGTGNWETPANWTGGVAPLAEDVTTINNGGTAIIDGINVEVAGIDIAYFNSGSLRIENGGTLTTGILMAGFSSSGGGATITVTGNGSNLTVLSSDLVTPIGYGTNGYGELNVLDGGTFSADWLTVGTQVSGTGRLLVSGSGSRVETDYHLSGIGFRGDGIATLQNGGELYAASSLRLGYDGTAKGTLIIGNGQSAGILTASELLGGNGDADLVFSQTDLAYTFATPITGSIHVTHLASGTTILTGSNTYSGGTTLSQGTLQIGDGGLSGSLGMGPVANSGQLVINRAGALSYGGSISGTGQLRVVGSGTVTLSGSSSYTGTTSISNGTLVVANNNALGAYTSPYSIHVTGSNGTLSINSGITLSKLVGVSNGGHVNNRGHIDSSSSSGIFTPSGAAHVLNSGTITGSSYSVYLDTGSVTNTGRMEGNVYIQGDGLVRNEAGGVILDGVDLRGGSEGLVGLVNTGSSAIYGMVSVVTGDITNSNGSLIQNDDYIAVSLDAGWATPTLTNSGSSTIRGVDYGVYATSDWFQEVTINNIGGSVITSATTSDGVAGIYMTYQTSAEPGIVYNDATSSVIGRRYGIYMEGGGTVTNEGTIIRTLTSGTNAGVRFSGTNSILVNSGTIQGGVLMANYVNSVTLHAGSLIDGNLAMGNRNTSQLILTGNSGPHLLSTAVTGTTTTSGTLVKQGLGTWVIDRNLTTTRSVSITDGVLQIGNGGTVGSVNGNIANASGLVYNRSDTVTLSGTVSGVGSLTQSGSGTLVIANRQTYTGATDITAGTLRVTGTLGGSPVVNVHNGGTLEGTGLISGTVNVLSGGHLSAGTSPGTLTLGALALNSGAISTFELGTSSDRVNVSGNLTLDGILNLANSSGFANTSYTLFTYGGALTNHYFELNLVPTGWNRAQFVIDLSTTGQVNLLADNTVTLQYWNGADTEPTGSITGGSGTWSATGENWTNSNGSLNTDWQGVVGIFSGTGGDVSVADAVAFEELQFEDSGYRLTDGGGTLTTGAAGSELWVATGVEAEVAVGLSGSGALLKSGGGGLILSASNAHTGGTIIGNGTLQATHANALGAGDVTLQSLGMLEAGVALTIGGDFIWEGGTLRQTLGTQTTTLHISGALDNSGGGGEFAFTAGSGFAFNTAYTVLTFADGSNFSTSGLTANAFDGISPTFHLLNTGNSLQVIYLGATTGPLLQNSSAIHTPVDELFTVEGAVQTGTDAESNEVLGLVFAEAGGSLVIHNTLTLGAGSITTGTGNAALVGGTLSTSTGYAIATGGEVTLGSVLSGSGGLAKSGTGTLRLLVGNSYSGGTVISNGTVQATHANALGAGDVTLQSLGTLEAGVALTIGGDFIWEGGILRQTLGTQTATLHISGALDNSGGGGEFAFTTGSGFAFNTAYTVFTFGDGSAFSTSGLTANTLDGIAATFHLLNTGSSLQVIYLGASTGPLLQNSPTIHTPVDQLFTVEGAVQTGTDAESNEVLGLVFAEAGGSLVIHNTLTLGAGSITSGTGNAALVGGTLTTGTGFAIATGGEVTLASSLAGSGGLTKSGTSTLRLLGANTYSGGTTIAEGTLSAESRTALAGGALALQAGGKLALTGAVEVASFTWSGGSIALGLGGVDQLQIAGAFASGGSAPFVFELDLAGFSINATHTLLTYSSQSGFEAADFLAPTFYGITPVFTLGEHALTLHYTGATSGPLLQNSAPVFTPTNANFVVSGSAATGGPGEDNTVASLLFEGGSVLEIHNTLNLSSGQLTALGGAALTGGTLATPGAFTKAGAGLLYTDSQVVAGGPVVIEQGGIVLNGTMQTSGGVHVTPGTYFGGSGVVVGNVFNEGTVNPGNSPGTFTTTGNYTQSPGGTFVLEIASSGNHDRLVVGGTATLAGTLAVAPLNGYGLELGQKFTFLKAGRVKGGFAQTLLPSGLRARLLTKKTSATLLIAPESYTQLARTPNEKALAKALDRFIPATGGDREVVSTALDELRSDQYAKAFQQIAPNFYEALPRLGIEQSNAQGQMLQQRFGAVRFGSRGFSQVGLEAATFSQADGILAPVASNPWGVWVQGQGLFARNSGLAAVPNSRSNSGGFLLGADYRWSDTLATGLYAGYQHTDTKFDGGSRDRVDAARFGAYATLDTGNGFYANATLGGGWAGHEVRRRIEFGSIDRTARATPEGGEFSALLGGGYDWRAGGFTFGPVASAQYTYLSLGGFTESGAKSLDLRLQAQEVSSLRSTLGARLAYTWEVARGVTLTPEARLAWQHEFLNDSRTLTASLDGGSGSSFTTATTTPERDAVFAGAGLNLQVGERWGANLWYNADFGRGDFRSQMVSGGVNLRF